ncbi:MAG: hypothetical protein KGL39_15720 [Patescibacteria group bacterium]|nr:hypothetical protein [Patescibacteria group bacterium]
MASRKLSVKELAAALVRGPTYVYEMKRLGFRMAWNAESRCYEATLAEAHDWIVAHRFHLVRGKGVIKGDKRAR